LPIAGLQHDGGETLVGSWAALAATSPAARVAGVGSWALWVPSPALGFDGPDYVSSVDAMVRDATTLVMTAELGPDMPFDPAVRRTTAEAASDAGDDALPVESLPAADDTAAIDGRVVVHGDCAIAGAWTFLSGEDVGVYAVGAVPEWRRRGVARRLMLHVLAEARKRGARTASVQSTPMGQRLYASLGFRPVGRYEEWVVAPEASRVPSR
jgi:GNAT superfamily N-acetyltransferase